MLQNKSLIFDLFIRTFRKKYNGAYGKFFLKNLNYHNTRCVQGKVVIFGSRI